MLTPLGSLRSGFLDGDHRMKRANRGHYWIVDRTEIAVRSLSDRDSTHLY